MTSLVIARSTTFRGPPGRPLSVRPSRPSPAKERSIRRRSQVLMWPGARTCDAGLPDRDGQRLLFAGGRPDAHRDLPTGSCQARWPPVSGRSSGVEHVLAKGQSSGSTRPLHHSCPRGHPRPPRYRPVLLRFIAGRYRVYPRVRQFGERRRRGRPTVVLAPPAGPGTVHQGPTRCRLRPGREPRKPGQQASRPSPRDPSGAGCSTNRRPLDDHITTSPTPPSGPSPGTWSSREAGRARHTARAKRRRHGWPRPSGTSLVSVNATRLQRLGYLGAPGREAALCRALRALPRFDQRRGRRLRPARRNWP